MFVHRYLVLRNGGRNICEKRTRNTASTTVDTVASGGQDLRGRTQSLVLMKNTMKKNVKAVSLSVQRIDWAIINS